MSRTKRQSKIEPKKKPSPGKKSSQQSKETSNPENSVVTGDSGSLEPGTFVRTKSPDKETVLYLQRRHGNAFVKRFLQRREQEIGQSPGSALYNSRTRVGPFIPSRSDLIMKQDLLSDTEKTAAISYHNRRYQRMSTQIIQITSGGAVTGTFDAASAESVARYQDSHGLVLIDGKVGPETLNAMVPDRVAARRHEHAIQLVVDFHNLERSDTLTIHHDPSFGAGVISSVQFESGNQRVVKLGDGAFTSGDDLRDAIRDALAEPAPPGPAVGERPEHLTREQEEAATAYNRAQYTDRRSIAGIQGVVGTAYDRIFGPDTAERIADFQNSNGLAVNGMVNEETLEAMVARLDTMGSQNAAIRMIMDFYNMSDYGALLDISYDATVTSNATTSGNIPGPSLIKIGRPMFDREFPALVHTIAHELEHVRQRNEGILRQPIREFLGEAIEIVSTGMPEETLAGMMDDARRCISFWNLMTEDEQRTYWERFQQVRDQVRDRFNHASAAEQATHQVTMDSYNAVTEPAP